MISSVCTAFLTTSVIVSPVSFVSLSISISSFFDRSIILFLLATLTSSTFSTLISALQGPTLSIVSNADASIAVSTLSRLDGTVISPSDFPFFESMFTSILPILPLFCKSLRSSSSPNSPSVCPKIAPTTSGFSTTPSAVILAFIRYFIVVGSKYIFITPEKNTYLSVVMPETPVMGLQALAQWGSCCVKQHNLK